MAIAVALIYLFSGIVMVMQGQYLMAACLIGIASLAIVLRKLHDSRVKREAELVADRENGKERPQLAA